MTALPPAPSKRSRAAWLAAGLVAVGLAGGAGAFYFWQRSGPPSVPVVSAPLPPLTASPFLNTKPGVAYVGDQACVGCHRDQHKAYRRHPMGRSLFRAAAAPPLEQFDHKSNPFQAGPFHFQVKRVGRKLIHKEWCQDAKGNIVAEVQAEMAYAIGSGSQARSYLLQRDGFLFESPITWFVQKGEWQLSPGYDQNLSHFHRRIDPRCLYCHCQEARPVEHTLNRYQEPPFGQLAIGCERCHGPGELHVASRKKGPQPEDMDLTIVNPRHLAPALREAVCEQCHLQGEAIIPRRGRTQADYRPGLPLHEYVSLFVRPTEAGDAKMIVGHVEQMHQSTCFKKSAGKFGCTSCHDPHGLPAPDEKVIFYRERCLDCHGPVPRPMTRRPKVKAPECSVPLEERTAKDARDNCLTCHMPRNPSSVATHLAVTDHRVLRHLGRPPRGGARAGRRDIPLLAFHRPLLAPEDEDSPRDLALAAIPLAVSARDFGGEQVAAYLTRRALPLLDQAVAQAPDDVPALEARGFALFVQGQLDDALKALEGALDKAPEREQALTWATEAALAKGRLDVAERYGRRLTEHYPHYPGHHERLAIVYVRQKAWPRALEAAKAAVRGDPFRGASRGLLITAYLETGDRARAQAEFDVLGVIDPEHQGRIRGRVEERLQRMK